MKVPAFAKIVDEYRMIALMPVSYWNDDKQTPTQPALAMTGSQNASLYVSSAAYDPPSYSTTPAVICSNLYLISYGLYIFLISWIRRSGSLFYFMLTGVS